MLVLATRRDLQALASGLVAIEKAIAQLADTELDGHCPLDDAGQASLSEVRAIIECVAYALGEFEGDIELPEPTDEDVELASQMIRRAAT